MVDTQEVQQAVIKIFESCDIGYFIGYTENADGGYVVPFFAKKKQDIQYLTFSSFCVNNLAMYLKNWEGDKKIGIIVKGCDSRSVVQLINEKRIPRENLIIVGVSCDGVIDEKKLQQLFPTIVNPQGIMEKEDVFVIQYEGKTHHIPKKNLLLEKCLHCEYPTPLVYDVLLGGKKQPHGSEEYSDVAAIETKSLEEKWKFWESQFARCIRCYACRNICPVCYCKECAAEQLNPQWLRRSVSISENTVWHLTRAIHVAGRCTGCGECERVCPMNIPLMLLNKKILKEIKEVFEYTPGSSLESKPLLAVYKPDDPEECIV